MQLTTAHTDFMRSILEGPHGMVLFTLDRDYRYTAFSVAHVHVMKAIWGVEITVGTSMLEVILDDVDRNKARRNFDRALQGEYFTLVEEYGDVAHLRSFYENHYGPVKDSDSHISGLSVLVIDISEPMRNENALKQSEERLRSVLNSLPDLIFKINSQGYYLEFLSNIIQHGHIRSLAGAHVNDNFDAAIALRYTEAISDCLRNKTIHTIDYELIENGSSRSYEARFVPFNNKEVLVLVQDITVRKKKDQELVKLSLIAKHTSNAVIITDAEGKIEWINEGFTRVTEYTVDEVINKKPGSFLQGQESDENVLAVIRDSIRSKIPFHVELINYTKSGRKYWVNINAQPIVNEAGDVIKFFAIESDVTERKLFEIKILEQNTKLTAIAENLTRKNTQLEEFTQIVSHNLRSPIGNISALIEHLNSSNDESERLDIISHLKSSSESLMLTMNELNEVLKIKYAGHIEKQIIELRAVFEKVSGMLQLQINEIGAVVTADFSRAPQLKYPIIYIESIVLNLLSNALKYYAAERKPFIHFESWKEDNQILMRVTDNGLGVDLARYGHQIFKLRKTFHKHPESRGVGLFMIRNQIEAMGGEINVISDVNVGTTFLINFGPESYGD